MEPLQDQPSAALGNTNNGHIPISTPNSQENKRKRVMIDEENTEAPNAKRDHISNDEWSPTEEKQARDAWAADEAKKPEYSKPESRGQRYVDGVLRNYHSDDGSDGPPIAGIAWRAAFMRNFWNRSPSGR